MEKSLVVVTLIMTAIRILHILTHLFLLTFLSEVNAQERSNMGSAFIISGGKPIGNFCSIKKRIEGANETFSEWERINYYMEGGDSSGELPNSRACTKWGRTIYEKDGRVRLAQTRLKNVEGTEVRPATFESIRDGFISHVNQTPPPTPVYFYIHNHGGKADPPKETRVTLWNGEVITVSQLREMLSHVPKSTRVILTSDSCFGGGMLDAIYPDNEEDSIEPRPNTCGFAVGSAEESIYDGELFMDMANTMARHQIVKNKRQYDQDGDGNLSFNEVFGHIQESYHTYSSTPQSSSSLFLQRYILNKENESMEGRKSLLAADCIFKENYFAEIMKLTNSSQLPLVNLAVKKLKHNLINDFAGAGISKDTSYEDIKSKLMTREDDYKKSEEATVKAWEELKEIVMPFVAEKMGKKEYEKLQGLNACINGDRTKGIEACEGDLCPGRCYTEMKSKDEAESKLRSCYEGCSKGEPGNSCRNECVGNETSRLQNNADQWVVAARQGKRSFRRFMQGRGQSTPYVNWKKARKKEAIALSRLLALRRLDNTLRSINGLKQMVNDSRSIDQATRDRATKGMMSYIDMLNCENTPIRPLDIPPRRSK